MKKHWKEIVFILPSLVVAVAAVFGFWASIPEFLPITYPKENTVRAAEDSPAPGGENANLDALLKKNPKKDHSQNDDSGKKLKKMSYTGDGTWKDGTYTGSGTGFGGQIEVSVTIVDGKIMDIQIISSAGETPSYLEQARGVISRMMAAQSPNVDIVSGATYSSNGIRNAVIQALNKAGGNLSAEPQPKSTPQKKKKSTAKKETTPASKGQPMDGVYSGSAVCEQFGYTIRLKVRFKNGRAVSLYGMEVIGNEDEQNEAYWKKAWKPMVKRILKAQNTGVDAVSGATYSSNAIVQAYQNARDKAVKAGKDKDKEDKNSHTKSSPSPSPSPVPAILLPDETPQVTGIVKDGVYTVRAACEPDERKAFSAYTLTADVTFVDGKCTLIDNFSSTDESNRSYYLKAANGTAKDSGVVAQILLKQSASGINAVSGATCSSKTIRTLYLQALGDATGVIQEEPVDDADKPLAVQTPLPLSSVSPEPSVSSVPSVSPEPSMSPVPSVSPEPSMPSVPSASSVPSVSPTPSASGDSSVALVKDGTYTASAMVVADEWEEFVDYNLTADVTFSGGKLTGIANIVLGDPSNQWYCNAAANGYGSKKGIVQQLIDRQDGKVDAVSGATCSSMALIQLYHHALEMAME